MTPAPMPELAAAFEPPEPEPEPVFAPEPEPDVDEDILELTDDMVADEEVPFEDSIPLEPEPAPRMAMPKFDIEPEEEDESILAPPVQQASTSALAELAFAVARERGVGLGRGGVTLEEIVREILRALIKDWLDQNLPYMIERIVKKEIEKMVNRAEKL
jgi:cell pole-organizing protein PopZ